MEEYFKDLKGLPLGLSTNNAWDYSIHMAHKMFQYWLYLVYKILHLNKVSIEMKERLMYKLKKDLLFYNTNYQHCTIPVSIIVLYLYVMPIVPSFTPRV